MPDFSILPSGWYDYHTASLQLVNMVKSGESAKTIGLILHQSADHELVYQRDLVADCLYAAIQEDRADVVNALFESSLINQDFVNIFLPVLLEKELPDEDSQLMSHWAYDYDSEELDLEDEEDFAEAYENLIDFLDLNPNEAKSVFMRHLLRNPDFDQALDNWYENNIEYKSCALVDALQDHVNVADNDTSALLSARHLYQFHQDSEEVEELNELMLKHPSASICIALGLHKVTQRVCEFGEEEVEDALEADIETLTQAAEEAVERSHKKTRRTIAV